MRSEKNTREDLLSVRRHFGSKRGKMFSDCVGAISDVIIGVQMWSNRKNICVGVG